MKNSNLIGALVIGAAAGAVISLLVAPAKGSETRKKLADGSKGISDSLCNMASDIVHTLKNRGKENMKNFYITYTLNRTLLKI